MQVYSDQVQGTKRARSSSVQSAQGQDEVILSSQVQEFGSFLQALKNVSDVREEKVSAISERIQSGTYQVNAQAIADKLMS